MTRELKAEIARRNGAKSRGPVTPTGKLHSSRNSMRDGKMAGKLKFWVPPDDASLTTESRQSYYRRVDELLDVYMPSNQAAMYLVRELAHITWKLDSLSALEVINCMRECQRLAAPVPTSNKSFLDLKLTREVDRLHRRIFQLQKALIQNKRRFGNGGKWSVAA